MKKRILAVVLSLCVLFAMATVVSAASVNVDTEIVKTIRLCPGEYVTDKTVGEPEVSGLVFSRGWEIKLPGSSEFVPYQGQALTEADDGAEVRYAVYSYDDEYAYSNVCTLIVEHNPTGSYLYSGTDHWRVCADCGGKSGEELHTFFNKPDVEHGNATACTVCGAHRTSQWTGLVSFFEWLFALIGTLFQ